MDLFKLCELYCLSDDSNPSIDSFFSCGCVDIKNENYKEALCKLLGELKTRTATTLINVSHEATKESIHYLASATFPFKNQ